MNPDDLSLTAIQFSDLRPGPEMTIPLRIDSESPPITPPEWRPGKHAAVAWRLDRTRDAQVHIRVEFLPAVSGSFEIKASDPSGTNLGGAIPVFRIDARADEPVDAVVLLDAPLLTDATRQHVGSHTDQWNWYARRHGQPDWVPIGGTTHRAYTVLGEPAPPWNRENEDTIVWARALDLAGRWAAGARNKDEAAGMVVRGFYDLGLATAAHTFKYDGASRYTWPLPASFFLLDMVNYIEHGWPSHPTVDCHDCASAVATLANALGASLSERPIAMPSGDIHTNSIAKIGTAPTTNNFVKHELAWSADGRVWDACLMVDGDGDPSATPHRFVLSSGMTFKNHAGLAYRERLATRSDASQLDPPDVISTEYNRPILKRPTQGPYYPRGDSGGSSGLGGFLSTVDLKPWRLLLWYQGTIGGLSAYYSFLALPPAANPRTSVEWYLCDSEHAATALMTGLLSLFSIRPTPIPVGGGYAIPSGAALFRYKTTVIRVLTPEPHSDEIFQLPSTIFSALEGAPGDVIQI